jgi:hydroxylamine reductase
MFCEQCEQTASGDGCHQWGACGKSPEVNAVQDLLVYCLRSLAPVVLKAKELNIDTHTIDVFTTKALFATMTNVNFSQESFADYVKEAIAFRENLKQQITEKSDQVISWSQLSNYTPDFNESLPNQGFEVSLPFISQAKDPDIFSLKLLVLYGVKGAASYAHLAQELGQEDEAVYRFYYEALNAIDHGDLTLNEWVELALNVGANNYRAMELLDAGHTNLYGHPVPTHIPLNAKKGKAILVSGHDIKATADLLEQTQNLGINVYTHGELLPAHGYPKLKEKYPHFYGHYGTAWQNQTKEFRKFPGAIVVTTNCLMPPHEDYGNKLFSMGAVGYPHLSYIPTIDGKPNFQPVIDRALELPGFTEDEASRSVMTGFAHNAVLNVADQVIEGVKEGKIRHFFLVGGCDGAKPGRSYYSDFVEQVPQDCIVLTLACGKFRFFDKKLGEIGNLPRLMDLGQCNDAYSAIQIALGLAKAFNVEVNELPLSMIISWYEQKAIAVLLTLLYLGIKDIRLGPTLPAFLSANVLKLISEKYNLKLISTPEKDLAECLA